MTRSLTPTPNLFFSFTPYQHGYAIKKFIGGKANVVLPAIYKGKPVLALLFSAFYGCRRLKSITISKTIVKIDEHAFLNCTGLTQITVEEGNSSFQSIDGNLYTKDGKTLWKYANGKQQSTFLLPNSVSVIGYGALENCINLSIIEVQENHPYFQSIDGNLYSKDGETLIQYAIGKKNTAFTVPNSVVTIEQRAFFCCEALTSIALPASLKKIGEQAFAGCTSLTSISLPSSIKEIGSLAFASCTSLTSIIISEGITTITKEAFACASGLTKITIPSSVTRIESGAFLACNSLESITFANPNGWYYTESGADAISGQTGTAADLSDPVANKKIFTETHTNYNWYK